MTSNALIFKAKNHLGSSYIKPFSKTGQPDNKTQTNWDKIIPKQVVNCVLLLLPSQINNSYKKVPEKEWTFPDGDGWQHSDSLYVIL